MRDASSVWTPPVPARIGPNALIQTRAVVRRLHGPATWDRLRTAAALPRTLPEEMVAERLFGRLVLALADELGTRGAARVLLHSGERTADYVRRNRIPALARGLLGVLPRALSTRLLLRSIHRHGWTFLGSGRMEHDVGSGRMEHGVEHDVASGRTGPGAHRIVIHRCVTCRDLRATHPMGGFYVGAFQGLLASLADSRLRVVETSCAAQGAPSCVFEIHTEPGPTPPLSGAPPPS